MVDRAPAAKGGRCCTKCLSSSPHACGGEAGERRRRPGIARLHSVIRSCVCFGLFRLGLLALDWTALHRTGLDWTGLHWTGLHWTALHWTALHWTAPGFTALDSLDWMDCTALWGPTGRWTTLH